MLEECKIVSQSKIIITYGTVTMSNTASFLGRYGINKTIILFGASIPANEKASEVLFNFGYSLATAKMLDHGVYIAMNGQNFTHSNVKKNMQTGNFETISSNTFYIFNKIIL